MLRIRRAATRTRGPAHVGLPKSAAGVRDVALPPHVVPALAAHVDGLAAGALLFPSPTDPERHLAHTTLQKAFARARHAAGRPDLRIHDLRHSAAVWAAQAGATIRELMGRLGHSTPGVAMRYQHVAAGRDRAIADALSKIAANPKGL